MSRSIQYLFAVSVFLAFSHAAGLWQEGPEPMPVPPVRTHLVQIANEGPEPMPVPPLHVQ
jgi:hypothetical protein